MKYDCRYNLPHDPQTIFQNNHVIWEVCKLCNKKFRWNKAFKSRIDNKKYVEVHARSLAQPNGKSRELYNKIYQPNNCVIKI